MNNQALKEAVCKKIEDEITNLVKHPMYFLYYTHGDVSAVSFDDLMPESISGRCCHAKSYDKVIIALTKLLSFLLLYPDSFHLINWRDQDYCLLNILQLLNDKSINHILFNYFQKGNEDWFFTFFYKSESEFKLKNLG